MTKKQKDLSAQNRRDLERENSELAQHLATATREILFMQDHQIPALKKQIKDLEQQLEILNLKELEFDTLSAKQYAESLDYIQNQSATFTFVDGARWMFSKLKRRISYQAKQIKELKKKLKEIGEAERATKSIKK